MLMLIFIGRKFNEIRLIKLHRLENGWQLSKCKDKCLGNIGERL